MNREKVKLLLSTASWNSELEAYRNGCIEQSDHEAFRFLWHRIAYRLSDTDIPHSWLSLKFDEGGYELCMNHINRVRKFWDLEALKV